MGARASQIASLRIVYLIVYSGADQRKHLSSASLPFVRGIHWWISRTTGQLHENISIWRRHHECVRGKSAMLMNKKYLFLCIIHLWHQMSIQSPLIFALFSLYCVLSRSIYWCHSGLLSWHRATHASTQVQPTWLTKYWDYKICQIITWIHFELPNMQYKTTNRIHFMSHVICTYKYSDH